ncbi:MAG: hypothetical protein NC338_08880 [Firmicutes bacterium]|nr:hypothetical protein [Bacillota bacterium]MCM1400518.1 hypothetical protein [Bacteroides sp.]MCM1476854.1 hypothetical protein [Bacteroides sp.]
MNDENIKQIFRNYNPELTPATDFISKLEKNLDMIEAVRQQNIQLKKHNKLAVAIAAICGFIVGTIFALLLPLVGGYLSTLTINEPVIFSASTMISPVTIAWILTALTSIITSVNAYEIAMAKLNRQ